MYTFPLELGFVPERLLVGGREGKQICIVFGDGGSTWCVYDVSGPVRQARAGGEPAVDDEWDDEGMDVDVGG